MSKRKGYGNMQHYETSSINAVWKWIFVVFFPFGTGFLFSFKNWPSSSSKYTSWLLHAAIHHVICKAMTQNIFLHSTVFSAIVCKINLKKERTTTEWARLVLGYVYLKCCDCWLIKSKKQHLLLLYQYELPFGNAIALRPARKQSLMRMKIVRRNNL